MITEQQRTERLSRITSSPMAACPGLAAPHPPTCRWLTGKPHAPAPSPTDKPRTGRPC